MKPVKIILLALLFLVTARNTNAGVTPSVEFFSPQGTVKGVRQVSVRFSEQIAPLGDPRAIIEPFDIICPMNGAQRWADGNNWVYDFDADLPPGLLCEFSLKPGLKTLSGHELSGKKVFSFSTGGPSILSIDPYAGSQSIDEGQIFLLHLDAEADEASVLSNVFFSVEGINERVGVNILKGEERELILKARHLEKARKPLIVISAKQNFPALAEVGLNWSKGVMTKTGVAAEADQSLNTFTVRGPFTAKFTCERENVDSGCKYRGRHTQIVFRDPLPANPSKARA